MSKKRKHLVILLVMLGIFSSYAIATEEVKKMSDETALATITKILNKGQSGVDGEKQHIYWYGELSNYDEILTGYLVKSNLYNKGNAETFVRTLNEDEVSDFLEIINDERLRETINVTLPTSSREK